MTETAQYADVILPGTSYAEKEGTFSNTGSRRACCFEREEYSVSGKAGDDTSEGEMRLDTDIFIDLMNRMGYPQAQLTIVRKRSWMRSRP